MEGIIKLGSRMLGSVLGLGWRSWHRMNQHCGLGSVLARAAHSVCHFPVAGGSVVAVVLLLLQVVAPHVVVRGQGAAGEG